MKTQKTIQVISDRELAINSKPFVIENETKHPDKPSQSTTLNMNTGLGKYKVRSRAYFYNQPDETTKRNAFIVHWNNALLYPIKVENEFIYIIFTNFMGQTSKGWLRKKDIFAVQE